MPTKKGTGIPDGISESWTQKSMIFPRALSTGPFDLVDQWVCEHMKDQVLNVNVLWEIAYGVYHEALHLNSLEDFNATEADLMAMKEDILARWKSRDTKENFIPQTHIHLIRGLKGQGSTLGRTFIPREATGSSGALRGPGGGMGGASSPFFRPLAPPPGIPSTSRLSPYIQEPLPTSFPMVGAPTTYNFRPP